MKIKRAIKLKRIIKRPPKVTKAQKDLTKKTKSKDQIKQSGTGITLREMYKVTPKFVRINADDVKILKSNHVKLKDGNVLLESITKSLPKPYNPKPQKRLTTIETIYGDAKLSGKGVKVNVSCSCEFFLYYCEVALFKAGSADIRYSNGKKPRVTNPKLIPLMCKHLVALSRDITQKGL